ncbi:MAG: hypothetical protein Q6L50_02350 [Gloeomargarita sp. GMQP_bins_120]
MNTGWRFWLGWLILLLLLGNLGLQGLVRGLVVLLVFFIVAPPLLLWGLRWWVRRQIAVGPCPVCSTSLQGWNQTQTQCPHCGERLQVKNGQFQRLTPPGTVEVEAVEVPEN